MGTRRIRSDDPVSQGPALITFAYIMMMMMILVMVLMMMTNILVMVMMMMIPVTCWVAKAGVD